MSIISIDSQYTTTTTNNNQHQTPQFVAFVEWYFMRFKWTAFSPKNTQTTSNHTKDKIQ